MSCIDCDIFHVDCDMSYHSYVDYYMSYVDCVISYVDCKISYSNISYVDRDMKLGPSRRGGLFSFQCFFFLFLFRLLKLFPQA